MPADPTPSRRRAARRLVAAVAVVAGLVAGLTAASSMGSTYYLPGAGPEGQLQVRRSAPATAAQGRVPQADYDSGRAARGYRCNTRRSRTTAAPAASRCSATPTTAAHLRVLRLDAALPARRARQRGRGHGVIVLDMNDPAHPRQTATLSRPAMRAPTSRCCSTSVAACWPACSAPRRPTPASSTSTTSHRLPPPPAAVDARRPACSATRAVQPQTADVHGAGTHGHPGRRRPHRPASPGRSSSSPACNYHGVRLSADGGTLYAANVGTPDPAGVSGAGLRILDVSACRTGGRTRRSTLSRLSLPEASIPQVAQPFTREGSHYVLEVDEYVDLFSCQGRLRPARLAVGAGRIIDVDDPRHPLVVSDLRLRCTSRPPAGEGVRRPGCV